MRPQDGTSPLEQAARVVMGMPHLCPNGLSENWLWKELGHRHWDMIGRVFGRAAAGFGPSSAEPTYAAFRRIALRNGGLEAVRENDTLDLHSRLTQVSAARVESRHVVSRRGSLVADVEMTSVFVRRQTGGVNRSVVRVRMDGLNGRAPVPGLDAATPDRASATAPVAAPAGDARDLGTAVIEPCPSLDFNGAGLLYFSSFVAAADRAEWHLLGKRDACATTAARSAIFHGNIEIGDDLTVQVSAISAASTVVHRALIHSRSDGRLLAEITTQRRR